jgi:hypothetical protein
VLDLVLDEQREHLANHLEPLLEELRVGLEK